MCVRLRIVIAIESVHKLFVASTKPIPFFHSFHVNGLQIVCAFHHFHSFFFQRIHMTNAKKTHRKQVNIGQCLEKKHIHIHQMATIHSNDAHIHLPSLIKND